LFLPQRTSLIFVRNVRVGGQCLHVTALFAMFAAAGNSYDFDPTTLPKKSGMTPVKQEDDGGFTAGT
jgi:hypothetical protein